VVVNTPYFALTDRTGAFRIAGVPAGEYTVRLWHERATDATLKALERKITLPGTLPKVVISEAGYLAVPHKNKHGLEYPPVPEETGPYTGGRK
jgi:hypothetical protein